MKISTLFQARLLAEIEYYQAVIDQDFDQASRRGRLMDKLNPRIMEGIRELEEGE